MYRNIILCSSFFFVFALKAVVSDAYNNFGKVLNIKNRPDRNNHFLFKTRRPTFPQLYSTASAKSTEVTVVQSGLTPPYTLSTPQYIYVVLTSIFVTCLIVADVIGVKLFEFKLPFTILGHNSVEHTCGMLTFPVTFLLGDIINEYYVSNDT